MDALDQAKFFATTHHILLRKPSQMYGNLPYTHHLAAVESVMRELGETREDMLVATWLHDIVEDTDVKVRDVEEAFGERVAELVDAVTADPLLERKLRNALVYPKIRKVGPDAVRLKLADRIANVTNAGSMGKKYAREYEDFRHGLRQENDALNWNAWVWLDDEIDHILGETRWLTY